MVEKLKKIKAYEVQELMRGPDHTPATSRRFDGTPIVSFEVGAGLPEGAETFVSSVIVDLVRRGYRVAGIKRCGENVQPALPESLTGSYEQGGCRTVLYTTPNQMVLACEKDEEPSPEEMLAFLGNDYDVIVAEGFRFMYVPKFLLTDKVQEVFTSALPSVIGYVSADEVHATIPHFEPRDVAGVVDKIETDIIGPYAADRTALLVDGVAVPLSADHLMAVEKLIDDLMKDLPDESSTHCVQIRAYRHACAPEDEDVTVIGSDGPEAEDAAVLGTENMEA